MTIRSEHWYAANRGRQYPLDDLATGLDDAGLALPSQLIVDMHLLWPDTLGRCVFLSSVYFSPQLVSVTFLAAMDVNSAPEFFVPLGVLSLTSTIIPGKNYAIEPQADGVGGWIVFGAKPQGSVAYQHRFSTPAQSLITAKACRPYRPLPVTSLGRLYDTNALRGVVKLIADAPLEVVAETRDIDGSVRDVAVIRLVQPSTQTEPVLSQYAGPCAARPESGTCGDPQPIEFIDSVGPDCNGQITLEFRGCARPGQIIEGTGVVLDCQLGIDDVCVRDRRLPDAEGNLPLGDVPKVVGGVPGASIDSIGGDPEDWSESLGNCELPYCEAFDSPLGPNAEWIIMSGQFLPVAVASPLEAALCDISSENYAWSTAGLLGYPAGYRNMALWYHCDDTSVGRRATTHFYMVDVGKGGYHNAGIIFNWRPRNDKAGEQYFLAWLDYDTQQLRLSFSANYDGLQNQALMPAPGTMLNTWYSLSVDIADTSPYPDNVQVTVVLTHLDSGYSWTLGPVDVRYSPTDGVFGIWTYISGVHFAGFRVEAI